MLLVGEENKTGPQARRRHAVDFNVSKPYDMLPASMSARRTKILPLGTDKANFLRPPCFVDRLAAKQLFELMYATDCAFYAQGRALCCRDAVR